MIDWPNILLEAATGGVVGFLLVHFVDWWWRPRVKEYGFREAKVNFGTLYKLCFILKGRSQPGLCALTIEWDGKSVFAKWDETLNPLEGDDLSKFRPELVPSTFYLPLFHGRRYKVPVIAKNNDSYEVFSGWWFGRNQGYGPKPQLLISDKIRLTLTGGNFSWSKSFPVSKIVGRSSRA